MENAKKSLFFSAKFLFFITNMSIYLSYRAVMMDILYHILWPETENSP